MKPKNLLQILGLRGKAKRYGYEEHEFPFDEGKTVTYARWSHPGEARKSITQEQIDAYRKIISEGDFCIDIGAHTGDSTLPIAIAAGQSGHVLALEPNPFVFHVLQKNARANKGITNIEPLLAAAADHEGFLQFEYSDSGFCNGGRHENIPLLAHGHAFKLEVFCLHLANELKSAYADQLDRLTFIKTDAEGFDLYVIKGLLPVIRECRPIVKVEVFKNTNTEYRKELLHLFEEMNYEVLIVDEEPIKLGARLTEANLHDRVHYDILCTPRK